MKIMIIRHGAPDYVNDSLLPEGREEARLLAEFLSKKEITDFYVSPLGRAQATARYTLDRMGRTAETLDWLREFPAKLRHWETEELLKACPTPWDTSFGEERICWDILPSYWTEVEDFYHKDNWRNTELCAHSDMPQVYDHVVQSLDKLLEKYGYVREGNHYKVVKSSGDTVAFFCHFGVECILLSHLLGISPFVLWHTFVATPTSVTLLNTEEREQGFAIFRASCFGDTSHLALGHREPTFFGRYCERFEDDTLH